MEADIDHHRDRSGGNPCPNERSDAHQNDDGAHSSLDELIGADFEFRIRITQTPGKQGTDDPARHHEQVKFQFEENHPAGNDRDDGKQREKGEGKCRFFMRGHSRSPCSCIVGFEKSGRLFLIPARYRESDVILVVPAFKVGTTPESYELKSVFVRFSIDKEKIRLQLAFQIITPFAGQRVRRHTHHEFKITRQNGEQVFNGSLPARILADSFQVLLEGWGCFNCSHRCWP